MTVIARVVAVRSSRYLCEEERVRIGDLRRAGDSMRGIAAELVQDVSTISRELARILDDRQRYRPFAAQQMATARLARPRPRWVEQDLVPAAAVQFKLDVKWSPEQISNTLVEARAAHHGSHRHRTEHCFHRASGGVVPVVDLGPGHRDGRPRPADAGGRDAGVLRRRTQPVAARQQRELQRTIAAVFPQGTDLAMLSPRRLAEVQDEPNARPRKRYQWATPAARLATLQAPHG